MLTKVNLKDFETPEIWIKDRYGVEYKFEPIKPITIDKIYRGGGVKPKDDDVSVEEKLELLPI